MDGLGYGAKSKGHGRTLLKGAGGSFFVKVVGAGILFGTQIALARTMGVESYGTYIYVLAWIGILALVSKFGLDITALRYVPRYQLQREWGLMRGFFRYNNYTHLAISVLVAIVLALLTWRFFRHSGYELYYTLLLSCVLLPVLVRMQMRGVYLQSFKHVVLAQWPEQLLKPLLIVLGLALFYVFRGGAGAPAGMAMNLLASVVCLALLGSFLSRTAPAESRGYPERYRIGEWSRMGLTFLLLSGSEFLLYQIDIIMIGYFLGTTEAGLYSAASRLVKLLSFGIVAINTIAAPIISQLYVTSDRTELQRIITMAAIGSILYFIPACVVIVFFGKALLGLFGPLFLAGYTVLLILTASRLIDSLTGLVGYLMMMTNHHNVAMKIQVATLTINIFMNLILIPAYGMKGAAVATASSMVAWNVMSLIYVRMRLDINPTVFSIRNCKNLLTSYLKR